MLRAILSAILLLSSTTLPHAQSRQAVAPPDPFVLREVTSAPGWQDRASATLRSQTIDPTKKTLVLITAGQSIWANGAPSHAPTNASVIDNFSIYDGALYSIVGPLLGCSHSPGRGPGNLAVYLADLFVTNGQFNRVIIVPTAIGGTVIAQWDAGGVLDDRLAVAMRRLASRGITPAKTGVTFTFIWGQGASDTGTAQAAWQAAFGRIHSSLTSAGFSGRSFVVQETLLAGVTNSTIRDAQAAVVNGTTIFSGGDFDTLTGATNRIADNTHMTAVGQAAAATLTYNAMHATGAPF